MKTEKYTAVCRGILPLGVVVFALWLVLLVITSQSTFWERDESRYATASLEMYTSGNWLYPTFNGELRANQPVMIYWLMASSIHVFGPGEVSVRLPATLAAALVCFLTGLIAREFLGTGVTAAIIIGTSPMLLLTGGAATTDATLLAFILLSQTVFVHAWTRGPRWWQVPAMAVAIGLAMLTKGPVGLAVPVLSIFTALVLAGGRSAAGPFALKLAMAALGGFLIFLAWGIPANAATGNAYWEIAIARRLPKFLFSAMEGHGGQGVIPYLLHLPYYLLIFAVGFLPWTMYLVLVPKSFARMRSEGGGDWARSPDGLRALLLGMIVPTFVLMTLMVSKLPHYIQPVFPWFAILTAAALLAARGGAFEAVAAKRMRGIFLVLGPLSVLGAIALMVAPWVWAPLLDFRREGIGLGLLLLASVAILAWCYWRNRLRTAVKIHAVIIVVFVLGCVFLLLPSIEPLVKSAQLLSREIKAQVPPGMVVGTLGWKEPGMHFYLGAPRINHMMDQTSLDAWLAGDGPRVLILNEAAAAGMSLPPRGFRFLASRKGIDPVHGDPLQLTAYLKE